ncbi:MAG: ABC transporter ATP-binding protein [Rhodospirillales bacterium]
MNRRSHPAWRLVGLFSTRKRAASLLIALVAVAAALDIAVPFVTQRLIDSLVASFQSSSPLELRVLLTSALMILAATVSARGIRSLYNYFLFKTVTSIEDQVRYQAFENYLRLDAQFHHGASSGQLIGRIDSGCGAVFAVLFDILGQNLVPPLIIFSGVLASLLYKNPWIALAICLPLPVYLAAVRGLTVRIYELEQQGCERFEEVAKERYDVAGNVITVKKFSQERAEIRRQYALQCKARDTQFRGERLWSLVENTQSLIATAGSVSVIFLAGWFVRSGRATVGEFVLYLTLSGMAYQPISQLSTILPRLRRNMARIERLFGVLDQRASVVDIPGARALPPLNRGIEFRNVWFRYGDSQRWVLRDVNLFVPAGATVALVGRSGSGKSTFINLLLRLFDPQHGCILIDGVDIREVTQESLRSQIAVVPQEVDLFSRTIAENIAYGRPGASREEIEEAARVALAHDFICRTGNGYDSLVGERGLKLSGGERQRIGIARAVLRNPRILILDEATSHLDSQSEHLIQQATHRAVRGRTSLLIAHRLSTILHAGSIVVFRRGGIEAIGTHRELLEISPTYRRLYSYYSNSPGGGRAARQPEYEMAVPDLTPAAQPGAAGVEKP